MIRSIFFDLDGTICDSREGIRGSVRHALGKMNLSPPEDDTIHGWIGPPLQDSFARYLRTRDPAKVDAALRLYRSHYERQGLFECATYPDLPGVLSSLEAKDYLLHLATAKPTVYAIRVLSVLGLIQHFEEARGREFRVTGSDLPGGNLDKREIIRRALDARRIDPAEAVMVGDREDDIRGAQENGVVSIAVTWGFGTRAEIEAAQPDHIIDHPDEIHEILARLTDTPGEAAPPERGDET